MVAISFSKCERFPEQILSGEKDQTIRPHNKNRYEQMERIKELQLYWKQRSPDGYKIADATLDDIFTIKLHPANNLTVERIQVPKSVMINPNPFSAVIDWKYVDCSKEQQREMIRRDGFDSQEEFYQAFHDLYGDDAYEMEFMVIRFSVEEDG